MENGNFLILYQDICEFCSPTQDLPAPVSPSSLLVSTELTPQKPFLDLFDGQSLQALHFSSVAFTFSCGPSEQKLPVSACASHPFRCLHTLPVALLAILHLGFLSELQICTHMDTQCIYMHMASSNRPEAFGN